MFDYQLLLQAVIDKCRAKPSGYWQMLGYSSVVLYNQLLTSAGLELAVIDKCWATAVCSYNQLLTSAGLELAVIDKCWATAVRSYKQLLTSVRLKQCAPTKTCWQLAESICSQISGYDSVLLQAAVDNVGKET